MASKAPLTLHATTVAFRHQGVLIIGPSGAGKSALALQLITLGAQLVSDDQTHVFPRNGRLVADTPAAIAGLIEARGVGLLRVPVAGPVPLTLVIDLSQTEAERLPYPHSHTVAEITLPCLWAVPAPHFAPAILLYLQGGLGVTP